MISKLPEATLAIIRQSLAFRLRQSSRPYTFYGYIQDLIRIADGAICPVGQSWRAEELALCEADEFDAACEQVWRLAQEK